MSSNVHGVKKVKTSEEIAAARKLKEAAKIKEYNDLVDKCRQEVHAGHYGMPTLRVTSQILQYNPDHYTIWNYRREILLRGVFVDMDEAQKTSLLQQDLAFFMELIRINPKSYWLWNHRRWCLATMTNPDWQQELKLVVKMLDLDARNFHGWGYRRYVVSQMRQCHIDTEESDDKEFEYTSTKIKQSFSNYSAWHYRSKLLPSIMKDMSAEERAAVGNKGMVGTYPLNALVELDLIKNALYTEPDDQSAWLYYWWLVGKVPQSVKVVGAYTVASTHSVFVVCDDEVLLAGDISVEAEHGKRIPGHWYGVASTTAHNPSSVWVFTADDTSLIQAVGSISLQKQNVILNSPEKTFAGPHGAIQVTHVTNTDLASLVGRLEACPAKNTVSLSKFTGNDSAEPHNIWQAKDHEALLLNEIQVLEELLDLEPDSKWVLQTMAHFLLQVEALKAQKGEEQDHEIRSRALDMIDRLSSIDSYRSKRYQDWRRNITTAPITADMEQIKARISECIEAHLLKYSAW